MGKAEGPLDLASTLSRVIAKLIEENEEAVADPASSLEVVNQAADNLVGLREARSKVNAIADGALDGDDKTVESELESLFLQLFRRVGWQP